MGLRHHFDFEAWCDEHATRSTKVVGYFATNLVSPADQSGKLLIGSDDFVRVWLNRRQVHEKKLRRAVRFAEDVVPVEFRAGNSVLLIKLFQHSGTSGLLVAVEGAAEADGERGRSRIRKRRRRSKRHACGDIHSVRRPTHKDGQPLPSIDELTKTPATPKPAKRSSRARLARSASPATRSALKAACSARR